MDMLTSETATRCGLHAWQLRRLDERGLVPKPRFAGRWRIYSEADLPAIVEAARKCGYLKTQDAESHAGQGVALA